MATNNEPDTRTPSTEELAQALSCILHEIVDIPRGKVTAHHWIAGLAWGEASETTDGDLDLAVAALGSKPLTYWRAICERADALRRQWGLPPRFRSL